MTNENYIKAKNLRERIIQLNIIKSYMTTLFNGSPVKVSAEFTFFGTEQKLHLFGLNDHITTLQIAGGEEDDFNVIIKSIEERISVLEKEFETIK